MTDKEFKRLSRAQLIDIIYKLQLELDKVNEEKQELESKFADKRLRLQSAGNIAEAALEINDCFRSAQNAAEQYLNEIKAIREETSGGQKQRVAIARTLSMEPEIILFDEPTSALDTTMIGEAQAVIRDLAKQGTTMIIVTHEMKFSREICNRVFYMDQGGIYEDGTPDQIFDHPQKGHTRHFIRRLKVLEYSITSQDFDFIGFNTQIKEFGRKNRISQRKIYSIQAYIEEMCVQVVLPQMISPFEMLVTIEYSEEQDDADVVLRYGGAAFDPMKTDNELSLLLAKKATENIVYSFDREQVLCNRVDAQI